MKRYNKLIILGLVAGSTITLSSCGDFLNEPSKTALPEQVIYSDTANVEKSITGAYRNMRNLFTDARAWQLLVGTDEIQGGAYQCKEQAPRAALNYYNSLFTADNPNSTEQWNVRWPIINESAKVINAMSGNVQSGTYAGHLFGEASFLRGTLDMQLAMLFGRIPIIDYARQTELGYGRQPLVDVWTFIINDLENAATYCPTTNAPQRATQYAAKMMLGYAYMSAPEETGLRDFQKAKDALEAVVNGPFSLVDYAALWDYTQSNTAESIFEWQFNNSPDQNMIQFQIGSRAVQGLTGDGGYYAGYDSAVPTVWAYSDVADGGIWEEGDVRKDESIRYDFTYYGQTPTIHPNLDWEDLGDDYDELDPHIKKYEDFRTDSHSGLNINNMWNSGKNIPWLRLGNAILLYAECLNELGQTSDAVTQVNKVRARAGVAGWTTMSQDQFRTEILTERVRELFGENWRKFDLIRTGKMVELVKARNKWTNRINAMDQNDVLWPIPQSELQQNLDMAGDQNPGYE